MTYETDEVAEVLKAARIRKDLTQRELGQRAGVPQAHISKIEKGAVDLRLSSLIAIARVLDLEVELVPRKALPAVQSIVRSNQQVAIGHSAAGVLKELQRLQDSLGSIKKLTQGSKELAQLHHLIRELQHLRLTNEHLVTVKNATSALRAYRDHKMGMEEINRALMNLQALRNTIAHQTDSSITPNVARPAYTLDDELNNG